jgi:hypothetical protein
MWCMHIHTYTLCYPHIHTTHYYYPRTVDLHEVQRLGLLPGHLRHRLVEQVACALDFFATESVQEALLVCVFVCVCVGVREYTYIHVHNLYSHEHTYTCASVP